MKGIDMSPSASIIQQNIHQTRAYLFASAIEEAEKDGLILQLNAAEYAIAKAQDPALSELVAHRTCYEVKQAIRLPSMIDKAVKAAVQLHASTCKSKGPELEGKAGTLFAFRWPICVFGCVVVFSPNFPAVSAIVEKILK